jgi:hypothetical protein
MGACKILIFFAVAAIAGFVFYYLFTAWRKRCGRDLSVLPLWVLRFVSFSHKSVKDTSVLRYYGCIYAGLIISNTQTNKYIANRFETLSFLLLSPIFSQHRNQV